MHSTYSHDQYLLLILSWSGRKDMKIEAKVVPNARSFGIEYAEGRLKVRLTEEAEKGRANLELEQELSKLLMCPVKIIRGATARRKLLEIGVEDEKEFLKRIANAGKKKAP
ncbi:MAG: DUF167 domain-containing protein [Candidatus Micrarchaeota archaeon]